MLYFSQVFWAFIWSFAYKKKIYCVVCSYFSFFTILYCADEWFSSYPRKNIFVQSSSECQPSVSVKIFSCQYWHYFSDHRSFTLIEGFFSYYFNIFICSSFFLDSPIALLLTMSVCSVSYNLSDVQKVTWIKTKNNTSTPILLTFKEIEHPIFE